MQPIGIGRFVGDQAEIEFGHHALDPIAHLPNRHLDAGCMHGIANAERGQHLDRRRVERTGAQVVRQAGFGLQDQDRQPGEPQCQGRGQPGRAGADDDDRVVEGHGPAGS